ncbi:aldo/keto reductase [Amycolatopsis ultiminotia]|uniref:Aldo/keto reductase n=1 Tax=Amycolatopsis ultiminotia TaxID=543629 RepID=A0ABP6YMV3_9PSEU
MEKREITRLGRAVSAVGLGCWQLGADWGSVDEADAMDVLHTAADEGVTFFDTADVYGDGRSETLVGRFRKERGDDVLVATKMGRRAEQVPENYVAANFAEWNDRSRRNLGMDTLDLVQLHCPPTPVYASDAVYDALDDLVDKGRIKAYGVSVETCEEALTALRRPNIASVQIILNCLRLKPLEQVLPTAAEVGAGIIVRVPLASGLLSGRYTKDTTFSSDDHRSFNRHGEAFDVGETFAGVPFEAGLEAVERLRGLVPEGQTLAQFALRWILDQSGVSVVIPGARNTDQARANTVAGGLPSLSDEALAGVRATYDELIRPLVHDKW